MRVRGIPPSIGDKTRWLAIHNVQLYSRLMIDTAGLRVMRAIADEGSFTAAAHKLGFSQPAISQMVRRLEERAGTVLVERIGRTVRLTEAGEVLARHASPVLAALDAAEQEVAAIAGLRSGRVRLMAFPSASATLVPKALSHVKREYPDVSITFTEAEPPESLSALRAGTCDIAVAFTYEGVDLGRGEEDVDGFEVTPSSTTRCASSSPLTTRLPGRSPRSPTCRRSRTRPGSPVAPVVEAISCRYAARPGSHRTSPSRPRTTSPSWG